MNTILKTISTPMKEPVKHLCFECTHLDWIDTGIYDDKAWCKIDDGKHRGPRSTANGSFCKDFKKSSRLSLRLRNFWRQKGS